MSRRLRSLWREDAGFSLVELSVALILSSLIVGTLVTLFFAFSQNVGDTTGKADHQGLAREMIAGIVVELRQAVVTDPNGYAIESLDADRLVFYTMPIDGGTPVRVAYERTDCLEGECELWVRRYAVDGLENGRYTFVGTPFETSFLLSGVLSDQPLFTGVTWSGTPKIKTPVASCGGSSRACSFPLVGITLRSRPIGTSDGARASLEIREEVRLRNV